MSLLALASLFLPHAVEAQGIVRGEVRGSVRSAPDERLLSEALVTVTDLLTGMSRWVESNREGRFRISSLEPGTYEVRVEALGHRPVLYRSVSVRSGEIARLPATLAAALPPVEEVDTVLAGVVGGLRFPGPGGREVAGEEVDAFPDLHRTLGELAVRSSAWDPSLGTQGLPARFTQVYLDGVPFTPARHPGRQAGTLALPGMPRLGLRTINFMDGAPDVEWSGAAGGYVSANTRPASTRRRAGIYGSGSTEALWSGDEFRDPSTPTANSGWGGATLELPLAGDSSRVFFAGEGVNVETPRSSPRTFTRGGAGLFDGLETPGGAPGDPWTRETWSASGLSRLDWSLSPQTEIMARVGVAHMEDSGSRVFGRPDGYGSEPAFTGTDIAGATSVVSRLGGGLAFELRAGFSQSERWYGANAGTEFDAVVPSTRLVGAQSLLGQEPGLDARVRRNGFDGRAAFRADLGVHALKIGIDGTVPSYDYDYAFGEEGEFFFSNAEAAIAGRGSFVGLDESPRPTSFSVPEFGTFLQYIWTPLPEFQLTSGFRAAWEFLPSDQVVLDTRWERLTGLRNSEFSDDLNKFGARVGISWDLTGQGTTFLHGTLSIHHDRFDPAALHEVISLQGDVTARRALGDLGASWPNAPASSVPSHRGARLSLLGPDLEAPRTGRATVSFHQTLASNVSLRVSGVFRRTDFLLRRKDLNLAPRPVAESEGRRPVFGELVKMGALVQPRPGSNRRFSEFDEVWALTSDGWSEYVGLSTALEHRSRWVDLFASYTFSETDDNWVGARFGTPGARTAPNLAGPLGRDWESGTSDFDVPHRLTVGLRTELEYLQGIEVGVLYRFRSGLPFTPTYAVGVDANGDGSSRNDPAFVPDLPEIRDLARENSCLSSSLGRIALRNSCRGPDVQTFDAKVSAVLFRYRGTATRLVIEGLNLLDAEDGPRDGALLQVEESGELVRDAGTGSIEIPAAVNPNFGLLLRSIGLGRRLRVGVKVGL